MVGIILPKIINIILKFLILWFIGFKTIYFCLRDVPLLGGRYISNHFIWVIFLVICETGIVYWQENLLLVHVYLVYKNMEVSLSLLPVNITMFEI